MAIAGLGAIGGLKYHTEVVAGGEEEEHPMEAMEEVGVDGEEEEAAMAAEVDVEVEVEAAEVVKTLKVKRRHDA